MSKKTDEEKIRAIKVVLEGWMKSLTGDVEAVSEIDDIVKEGTMERRRVRHLTRMFGWGGVVVLNRYAHDQTTYWEIIKHMTLVKQANVDKGFRNERAQKKDAEMVKLAMKMGDGQRWPNRITKQKVA